MNKENILDPESGAIIVVRESKAKGHCLWPTLCAVAVLGLVAVTSSFLLFQQRGLPTQQKSSASQLQELEATSADSDLPRLMKQVGSDPRGKIAAHLTADSTVKVGEVIWQKDTDSTFTEGVDFENNGLVIKTPGQYFVYTQVVFYHGGCQDKAIYLSHNITLHSNSYDDETLLLKATKSVCHYGPHQQHWYKTSYQGAIFQFGEGDHIFSKVSEKVESYVDRTLGKTFFGIFAL
ncbi:lymphotoxin-alpha-like [Pristis pectinata]|uniref:lymphotoxin-alpha-like n=1 Tax=Pristis pectinata TaxID=685728 RepID=UPI00223D6992|nr:lymphotoxin-alpha-like [Pristis pectinata]